MDADSRFQAAIAAFDRENSSDPTLVEAEGEVRPRALVQAERLSTWIERLEPSASEALRLAARCQHLKRWEIPRSDFPDGRIGYLEWRKRLGRFHADESAKILASVGYANDLIDRVRRINEKRGISSDPEVQTMEDALCLDFIEHELDEFSTRHDPQKVVAILEKTWNKMSPRAHVAARELLPRLSDRARHLVVTALGG